MQRSVLQTFRALAANSSSSSLAWHPGPSCSRRAIARPRTYASRPPPLAFDHAGFAEDDDGDASFGLRHDATAAAAGEDAAPAATPAPDVKRVKREWKEQQLREKELLAAARLDRLREDVETNRRHRVADWEAHLKEQERERVAQEKAKLQADREAKRRKGTEKFLNAKAARERRANQRVAQEQARMRLEEAMQRAAYELYGSRRRTSANAPAHIYDSSAYYALLALAPNDLGRLPSDDEVKDAWRKRMRAVHPDVPGGSTEAASRVNQAFEALQTDDARRAYQRKGLVLSGVSGVYR